MEMSLEEARDTMVFAQRMSDVLHVLARTSESFTDIKVLSAEFNSLQNMCVHLTEGSWMHHMDIMLNIYNNSPHNYHIGAVCEVVQSIEVKRLFKKNALTPAKNKLYRASFTFREVEFFCITTKEVCDQHGIALTKDT